MTVLVLYHGTTRESAARLLSEGWRPRAAGPGGQCGDPSLLYLTTEPENALWYAEQKGEDVVLEVRVDVTLLRADPEDGVGETVEEELSFASRHGLPANLAAFLPVPSEAFLERVLRPAP